MDGKKTYSIVINGITESANAVEALNKQLDALDKRIKALENSNVKVSAGGRGNASALSEEEAIQREINKLKKEGETLDAKIAASQDEIYKRVDATKQLYKETIADQKAMAAQERLTADAYSNTMQGMKSHLADLKAAINVTDLGDSDKIKQMTQEANELTNKLKEMEQAYGQFGRNVGNYASAADGFKGLVVQIGDATKEFDNAKQALKELKKERDTLSTKKDMGLISEEEAKRLQDLIPTVAQLQSSIQDAGKPMDALMDSMQSFVAVMQTTKGLSAFFGIDNTEVEKTIKNLVALQNAMQGLQTIQKQIQTREGIGGWIAPFTVQIDKATASLLRFNTALLGTGKAANVAAKGIKMVGTAMKALVSIGIVAIISVIVDKVMDLIESFNKLSDAEEAQKSAEEAMSKAYGEGMAKITQYKSKVDSFNGSKKEEKKLVEELNKELGDGLGTYKSIAEWQKVLKERGDAYIKTLQLQAKAQAIVNAMTAAYQKLQDNEFKKANGGYDGFINQMKQMVGLMKSYDQIDTETNNFIKFLNGQLNEVNAEIDKNNKENKLFEYSDQIKKNTTKTKKTLDDSQKTLNQLELRLMNEGLNKKLRQLDEEERQTINKLKENGRKTGAEIQKIQRAYAALRAKEINEYLRTLGQAIQESAKNISKVQFDINITDINNQIDEFKNKLEELSKDAPTINQLLSRSDTSFAFDIDTLRNSFALRLNEAEKYYQDTIALLEENIDERRKLNNRLINEEAQAASQLEEERYQAAQKPLQDRQNQLEKDIKGFNARNDAEKKQLEQLEADLKVINDQMEQQRQQHYAKLYQITDETNNKLKKNELDTQKEIVATQEKYFDIQLSNYRDLLSKLNDEINRNPVTNNWGIVNVSQTRKNYQEIIIAAQEAFAAIEKEKERLNSNFKKGLIDKEAFNATFNSLNDLEDEIINGMNVTKNASQNLIADFIQSAQVYLNAAMDSFQTIMGAVWDAQDIAFDKEQEQLDKENELLDKKLDEQQEIIERHKDAIESIEDELATSRGDRRQHLIDQLNAEMEAQRRAAAEEKKIQKQKEANEKKQDELEKKRKKAQYHRDMLQAVVNGAMAVTYAAINKWPIPAVPLMALAASTTAAQLAIMAANKPYAKGGLLEGPSHKQGGIPVGNTGIEVEGKEYVIRKKSSLENIDLLDYINKSERKLNLGDFIDFYGGKVKKNISAMSPGRKYADGGALPIIRNDYNFDDRLLSAFEDYSNRPVVVSVVDINNKQDQVRRVQTLAGL